MINRLVFFSLGREKVTIKLIVITIIMLISMFLTYIYGRHLEYKNFLKVEAKLQNNTAKLNEHLLNLLQEKDYQNAIQILKENLKVNQTMSDLNDVEFRGLSYFDSIKQFVFPGVMYDTDEHDELNTGKTENNQDN
jgi:hypothetical protein